MNGNVNGMTIRLLGCALAMLVLAAMSVTTGSFAKAADARDAAQANHVAGGLVSQLGGGGVDWQMRAVRFRVQAAAPRGNIGLGVLFCAVISASDGSGTGRPQWLRG